MATTYTSPFGAGFSPLTGWNRMGQIPIPTKVETAFTLSTALGTTRTLTAAEILGGILVIFCDDAGTVTLPTATLLNAAIQGAAVGASFDFDVINVGDATITFAVGTGGTATVGNSKATVLTLALLNSKRFTIRVTGVTQQGSTSDSYVLYGAGSIAASVA